MPVAATLATIRARRMSVLGCIAEDEDVRIPGYHIWGGWDKAGQGRAGGIGIGRNDTGYQARQISARGEGQ